MVMDEQKKQYWIKRITDEIQRNGEPVWYDGDLVWHLRDYFKVVESDLNNMKRIGLK